MKLSAQEVASVLQSEWQGPGLPEDPIGRIDFRPPNQASTLVFARQDRELLGVSPQWIRQNKSFVAGTIGTFADPPVEGVPHLRVDDGPAALYALARHVRKSIKGDFFAVMGSVGKTSTANMLGHLLRGVPGKKTRVFGSGNTPAYVAVDLLAADSGADFHVAEVAGATKAGRQPIAAVSAGILKPRVCIFSGLTPAHLDVMGTLENAARTKAKAFEMLEDSATVVLNRDMPHFEDIAGMVPAGVARITFGVAQEADIRLQSFDASAGLVQALVFGKKVEYLFGGEGPHLAVNGLGVLGALIAAALDWASLLPAFKDWRPLPGRGRRFQLKGSEGIIDVIDDSYNANPASMAAAIGVLSANLDAKRRVAVLGEMLELGSESVEYHGRLASLFSQSSIDSVHVLGPLYREFWDKLPLEKKGIHAKTLKELQLHLQEAMQPGDAILFKGSHGSRIHELVKWIQASGVPTA